jgi:membrane protease YdiL (CAAX protease family)
MGFIISTYQCFPNGSYSGAARGNIFQGVYSSESNERYAQGIGDIGHECFFAIVHFFKVEVMFEPSGFAPLAGFKVLAYFFQPLLNPIQIMPGFVGLFLAGVVLSYAYIWSDSLYMSIGIHAGLIFAIKGESVFLDRLGIVAPWFFGDGNVVTGVFGWIMLLCVLVILRYINPQKSYCQL